MFIKSDASSHILRYNRGGASPRTRSRVSRDNKGSSYKGGSAVLLDLGSLKETIFVSDSDVESLKTIPIVPQARSFKEINIEEIKDNFSEPARINSKKHSIKQGNVSTESK